MKSQSDLIAHGPLPTVCLVKMDKAKMIFMVTVYVGGFSTIVSTRITFTIQIIEGFRKAGSLFPYRIFFCNAEGVRGS